MKSILYHESIKVNYTLSEYFFFFSDVLKELREQQPACSSIALQVYCIALALLLQKCKTIKRIILLFIIFLGHKEVMQKMTFCLLACRIFMYQKQDI